MKIPKIPNHLIFWHGIGIIMWITIAILSFETFLGIQGIGSAILIIAGLLEPDEGDKYQWKYHFIGLYILFGFIYNCVGIFKTFKWIGKQVSTFNKYLNGERRGLGDDRGNPAKREAATNTFKEKINE